MIQITKSKSKYNDCISCCGSRKSNSAVFNVMIGPENAGKTVVSLCQDCLESLVSKSNMILYNEREGSD